jgi:signal peptidase I
MDETLATVGAPSPPNPDARVSHAESDWLNSVESLLTIIVIAIFVISFVIQAFRIPTDSMEGTLLVGDFLLVDKLHFGAKNGGILIPYRPIQRDDIVVFHYPINPDQHFVKRVVGLPGDRIRLINRRLYVNGVPANEPYVRHTRVQHDVYRDEFPRLNVLAQGLEGRWWLQLQKLVEDDQLIVPEGNYFVMGDNRDDSSDSRYWGFVPRENVIGRPLMIYWSLRSLSDDMPESPTMRDKIFHFAYGAVHLFQITRWDRTCRVVR